MDRVGFRIRCHLDEKQLDIDCGIHALLLWARRQAINLLVAASWQTGLMLLVGAQRFSLLNHVAEFSKSQVFQGSVQTGLAMSVHHQHMASAGRDITPRVK